MTKARTLADFNTASIPASVITGLPSGGKVLQVVNEVFTHDKSTTSSTFTSDTDWAKASITPTATDSKIYIQFNSTGQNSNGGEAFYTIYKDGTTNLAASTSGLCLTKIQDGGNTAPLSMSVVDAPNTTSSVEYRIFMKQNYSNTCYYGRGSLTSLTLIEIAA